MDVDSSGEMTKTRTSCRKKRLTERAQAFFDEVHTQNSERKGSPRKLGKGETNAVKSVRLTPLEEPEQVTHIVKQEEDLQDDNSLLEEEEEDGSLSDYNGDYIVFEESSEDEMNNESCVFVGKQKKTVLVLNIAEDVDDHFRVSGENQFENNKDTCDGPKGSGEDSDYKGSEEPKKRGSRSPGKGFLCSTCNNYFKNNRALCNHRRIHKQNPFLCSLCGKPFTQKTNFDTHMRSHSGVKNFQCGVCEYRAVYRAEIRRHMSKHAGERQYDCKACGKVFPSDSSLQNHMQYAHIQLEEDMCDMCDLPPNSEDIMNRHFIIKYTDKEHFECPVCNYKIRAKNTLLKEHMRKHTGEKPYHCQECDKAFVCSSDLAAHKRSHRPGKIPCDFCGRKFKTNYTLKRHAIIHTGDKPFVCHLCPYACNAKGNLTTHMKLVHKISPLTFEPL